jgi:DNA-binding LytR/AlgR family response regulator
MTKLLIVEDDPFLGDELIEEIKELYPHFDIVGPFDNYLSSVEAINTEKPDIALLDIELKNDISAGIKIARFINQTCQIPFIFITGLSDKSGFEIAKHTLPYNFLKKPYDATSLFHSLEMALVYQEHNGRHFEQTAVVSPNEENYIFVSTDRGVYERIPVKELIMLEADDKIVRAHLLYEKKSIVFISALKTFYEANYPLLRDFFKLGRKHVINLKMVIRMKDNHVHLPVPVPLAGKNEGEDIWKLHVPKDSKEQLLKRLGIKSE